VAAQNDSEIGIFVLALLNEAQVSALFILTRLTRNERYKSRGMTRVPLAKLRKVI